MENNELRDLREMVEDTHHMVSKIYKYQKRQNFFRVLKTIFLIVIIVGAYFAILPAFEKLKATYNDINDGISNFGTTFNFDSKNDKMQ